MCSPPSRTTEARGVYNASSSEARIVGQVTPEWNGGDTTAFVTVSATFHTARAQCIAWP